MRLKSKVKTLLKESGNAGFFTEARYIKAREYSTYIKERLTTEDLRAEYIHDIIVKNYNPAH